MSTERDATALPQEAGGIAGFNLANVMSRSLRQEFTVPQSAGIPEGPYFVYEMGPSLFLGRRGRGPLRIAWDTNLLVDYFQYGRALWDGETLPDLVGGSYGEELAGLQLIMALWVMRDIRFYIPKRALTDGKRALTGQQYEDRRRAFDEFARALSLLEWEESDQREPPPLVLPASVVDRVLRLLPAGTDRELVAEALSSGAHVFMTRDAGVLKTRAALRPLGLLVATPLDVLEELAACGALNCLLEPGCAYWPVPDLQRVTHLIRALPD